MASSCAPCRAQELHPPSFPSARACEKLLSFANTASAGPVLESSPLIRRECRRDDHAPDPTASASPRLLRGVSPARPREPSLAAAAHRLQAHGDPAAPTQD